MRKLLKTYIILVALICCANPTFAQVKEGLRIAVKQDKVFIYHNLKLPAGYGFHIYRDAEKLNDEPITGQLYPDEFAVALGDDYETLAGMMKAESPANLFFKLKSNLPMQRLASFLYPQIAQGLGRLYIDTPLIDGRQANYKIEITNNFGEPTGEIHEASVVLRPHDFPSPSNLSVTNKGERVTIKWNYEKPVKNEDDKVIQFNVFRRTAQGDEKLNNDIIIRNGAKREFKFNFESDAVGRPEEYFVNAVDITGDSRASNVITYVLKDTEAPAAVGGVNAITNENRITISWNMGTEPDLAGYNVYRSENMRDGYQKINKALLDALNTFFIDSTARHGKSFSYKISAVDLSGNEGVLSLAVQGRINDKIAPQSITDFTADLDNQTISLNWNPIQNQNGFRSYIVLRKQMNSGAKAYARLNKEDLRNNSWTDNGRGGNGFIEGVSYQYCVLAMDSARNFSDSVFVSLQIPDVTPPTPPEVAQATNKDGLFVQLRWTGSTSADTENYQIYRISESGETQKIALVYRDTRQYQDSSVVKGQTYSYAISAIDSLKNEGVQTSTEKVLVKDHDPPRSVRNVMIDLSNYQIKWEPVVAFDLAGYNIYQADIPTGEFRKINNEPWTTTLFTAESLEAGKWYRIRSVDESGNESKPSKPTQAK